MGIVREAHSELIRIALLLIAAFVTIATIPEAFGQGTPTPAQMEAFRNLPPDQQQAVLEAMEGREAGAARRDPQLSSPPLTPGPEASQQAGEQEQPVGPPRVGPSSTVLLEVSVREPLPTDPRRVELLNARRDRLNAGNPYRVDNQGQLTLPLMAPIAVSGLTDIQTAQRLNADPRLAGLNFLVTLLPVEPVGVEALKPFGYDIFGESPTSFALPTDIPVPADYRVGPGDNVTVELFGKRSARYLLVVGRNGTLVIPEFGPIQVAGLTFDQVREEIDRRVSEQMIGVRASVTMGELRSIRIFVVGDVNRPGAYTVSSLSTITNALFASGGVSEIGSLRNIELKRGGATVTRLDLYELLLRGDTSNDVPLQQGDTIFVPAIGSTASIAGQIRRPAVYEFRSGTTVGNLIDLAGGLTPEADGTLVTLDRIDASRQRTVLNLDIASAAGRAEQLRPGDVLTIPTVLNDTRGVSLEGHVHRPGRYALREGMRLSDLLGSLAAFKLNADQRYVLIRRESLPERRIHFVSADATRALANPLSADDPLLQRGDRVIAFSRQPDRGAAMSEMLEELRLQTRDNEAIPIVSINGRVRAPGEYPLEQSMTVADLVRAGGGMDETAFASTAELTRYVVVGGQARQTEIVEIDLANAAAGVQDADVVLRPYDVLVVKETPDWREKESITLVGEVRFPGTYPIRKGETLSSVIERAGGLTDISFPRGSVFVRQELKEQERQQVERLATRMQTDLTLLAVQGAQAGNDASAEALAAGQSLLTQLRTAQPTGRLVINLADALEDPKGENDIELRGGDQLMIPRMKQYVTVIGEVQNPTTHVFKSDLRRADYLELSGGTTQRADGKRIYVVRADGSVVASESPFWFRRGAATRLEPGDTIVVPMDAERMRPLPLWTAVTTIIYNLAVAVAAVNSF